MRLLILLAGVVVVTACDKGAAPLVDGSAAALPPVFGECPEADDAESMAQMPQALQVSPSVSAGSIAGSFSVTGTGEAAYAMPLSVPPGRAGMQPDVSIVYESSAGEGPLGMGFALGGLGSVTRCPKTVAQDGDVEPVRDLPTDALCLDGRRLVPVDAASAKPEVFRTFPETWSKIVADYAEDEGWDASRGPKSFTVYTRSGLILELGAAESGRVLAKKGVIRSWLLTQTRDRSGNAIDYSYLNTKHATEGYTVEHAIGRIDYTAHPEAKATRAVVFDYSSRDAAEVRILYARGMVLTRSLRLDHVRMQGPGASLVRTYNLTYATAPTTKRLLLSQIEECAVDQVCKPPTRFAWSHGKGTGFVDLPTSIAAPESKLGSFMLFDVSGDGLDDVVLPDVLKLAPEQPITEWNVALNKSDHVTPSFFGTVGVALQQDHMEAPLPMQPELGTPIDFNHDGRMDVFLHDVHGTYPTWRVLVAKPDSSFAMVDTKIPHAEPLGPGQALHLNAEQASIHLGDVSADGMTDLIECVHDGTEHVWRVHLWTPDGPGFDMAGSVIAPLEDRPCDAAFETVDIDVDGRVDLLVQKMVGPTLGNEYEALSYVQSTASWTVADTNLAPPGFGRMLFLDVNADGLPDAVQTTGFGEIFTFINTGDGFDDGHESLPPLPGQDAFASLATVIDANADGRQDILIPLPAPGGIPEWTVLQATGSVGDGTFKPVVAGLPFEPQLLLDEKVTLADPHGPRVTDVDGDQIQDVVMIVGGAVHVFKSTLHEEDLLLSVTDGLNAHDPGDPGFLPNVQIAYDPLIDLHKTTSADLGLPKASWTYLSESDPSRKPCAYPIRCVVGPRRVVSGYTLATGEATPRHYAVAYRDGRYDRLGRGFLGFSERITRDVDTGAGTLEIFDTTTYDKTLRDFPFAGEVAHAWRWNPPMPSERLAGEKTIELSYTDIKREEVKTLGGRSYFTRSIVTQQKREQGNVATCDPWLIEDYVRQTAKNPALVMSDSTQTVWGIDAYGNVTNEVANTTGVDDWTQIGRTFENDEDEWLLGLVKTETECGIAGAETKCRVSERTYDDKGLVRTESISADGGDPETMRTVKLTRDAFGNVIKTSDKDGAGHYRYTCTSYESEGIFPFAHRNPAGHLTLASYDPGLGVQTALVDPNGLVARWGHDGFGGVTKELRPDGTSTTYATARAKDGGPQKNAWNVKLRTVTDGGEDTTVELDPLGRPVRAWQQNVKIGAQAQPRVMQAIEFDELGEQVARSLVPTSELAAPNAASFEQWHYDTMGRPTKHITPWGAETTYRYVGRNVKVKGPGGAVTLLENDARGRPVKITDAEGGVMHYSYGAFGALRTVTDAGNSTTKIERDGLGRVTLYDDPDRGATATHYDGFNQQVSAVDAAGRAFAFAYDSLGRQISRTDPDGTTTWTYDTATSGKGRLAEVKSPGGINIAHSYDAQGRPTKTERTVNGETFAVAMTYDAQSRLDTLSYPEPGGLAPFVVKHQYDDYGHLIAVTNAATDIPYWGVLATDTAGRVTKERLGSGLLAPTTTRTYLDQKNRVQTIQTKVGATTVQSLSYGYDARLNVASRTDVRQGKTESFAYDLLDRLTGASFSFLLGAGTHFKYWSNGNLGFKSDVGNYVYDPAHPHAVLMAGGEFYVNDAVGNQRVRPGATVEYTAFDMPKTFSLDGGAGAIDLEYDGNQSRVRKTTPTRETIYFDDLYERVTPTPSGDVEHRFYVYGGERLVAMVTRKIGADDETRVVHVDNLGSIDTVTDADGKVVDRKSFDAFGAPRNPDWGSAWQHVARPGMTRGFTGHESDDEVGLLNAKGRLYDPKLGRFMTPDPFTASLTKSQAWNPFSYCSNNPLAYVDPTGFTANEVGAPVEEEKPGSIQVGFGGSPLVVHEARKAPPSPRREGKETRAASSDGDVGVAGHIASEAAASTATEADQPHGPFSVGDIALGGLKGWAKEGLAVGVTTGLVWAVGWEVLAFMHLAKLANGAWQGWQETSSASDALKGFISAWNPFGGLVDSADSTYQSAIDGDYPKAAETGFPLGLSLIFGAVAGGKAGGGASAAEEASVAATAGEAITAAAGKMRAYSVAFETTIPKAGAGNRPAHFKVANTALLAEMRSSPAFARAIHGLGIEVPTSGAAQRLSPSGWTWHHVPDAPGVLQLVPRSQHTPNSGFYGLMHPTGRGGFYLWGKDF